ncbi:hypothetical protein [Algisphaera agarilytica]|uniref:hypothetical protein n=1 Tax=Algisphaera agarilytica TaxID=1385975 RepID=UPI001C86B013|nr:hypothetical protein [Algisphaera agarilytica]
MAVGLAGLAGAAVADPGPTFVWWEAESPNTSTFPEQTWFSANDDPGWQYLSGGAWLTSTGIATADPPQASYELDIPEAGEYQLWVRKFWRHGPMHYRFGEAAWQTLGRDIPLVDRQRLPKDAEVDWVYLDTVELSAGETTFEIQLALQPGEDAVAGLDCFVLSREPFFPRGKFKPGERAADGVEVPDGWFALDEPLDTFRDDTLLDLRHLNEPEAGTHGPLRKSPDGNSIHLGDGTPVRFWGVNLSAQEAGQPDHIVQHTTRRLAKLGVNMIRHHSPLWIDNGLTYGTATSPVTLDPVKVERLHHLVAAAKTQGIYTNLSWYFPLWINDGGRLGLAGYDTLPADKRKPFAVLFFNDKAQQHYFDAMRELLTTPNPHTGLPLANDPALGLIELCNEDNLFFWTFDEKNLPAAQWELLERKFADHLKQKHGSLEAARKPWRKAKHDNDDWDGGRVGVYDAWHMTREAKDKLSNHELKRVAEQVEFLAGLQRGFYEKAVRVLRDELGYEGLISASNWYAADPTLMDAVERWTYTATDVIDQHGYFNPKHEGDAASYSVRVGQTFDSRAAVLLPQRPPLRTNQVEGHPQMISEMGWTTPNHYRADATLLTAAAMSLQGIDAVNFFIWNATGDFDTTMNKFALATPTMAGMFPAMALMARRGDLPEADIVVHEALRTENLFNLEGTAAVTDAALDGFRAADVQPGAKMAGDLETFDPFSAYVGRVSRSFDQPGDADLQLNLNGSINRLSQQMRTHNDSFQWDWKAGIVSIDSPHTQAAAGFFVNTPGVFLSNLSIRSNNYFGQITVTSLDDKPIDQSRKILIQAVTEESLSGFLATRSGKINSLGGQPWILKKIEASIEFHNPKHLFKRVIALDINGLPTNDIVTWEAENNSIVVTLPQNRLYTIIER